MKEKLLNRKTVFKGKILNVHVDEVEVNNKTAFREILEHNGAVCVYAEIDNEILLVKQFRYALNQELIELPAGKLENNENPIEAAIRELQEETGYLAENLQTMGIYYPSCGYLTEKIYLYKAVGLTFVGENPDEDEYLDIIKINKNEFKKSVLDNSITDGKTVALCLKVWALENN